MWKVIGIADQIAGSNNLGQSLFALIERNLPARPASAATERRHADAKSIKATVVLDAAALLDITVVNGSGPVPFVITAGEQTLKGQFNAKTLRRAATASRNSATTAVRGRSCVGESLPSWSGGCGRCCCVLRGSKSRECRPISTGC